MPTKQQLESALKNAHAAGDTTAAKSLANAIKEGKYDQPTDIGQRNLEAQQPTQTAAPDAVVGFGQGLISGAERGVKQTLGGITQKVAQARKSQLDSNIQNMIAKMQSGEITASPENLARLDEMQSQAVKLAQDLSGFEGLETTQREDYSRIQETAPVSSTIGNIAGQMAALPLPGLSQARLPAQMLAGAGAGALTGAIQPTISEEDNANETLMGAAIGGAAPAVLRPITNAIGGAYRSLAGAISGDEAQALKYAKEQNLPITTTDVVPPQTFAGRSAQALGEKIPITGTGGIRAEQQAARQSKVQDIYKQYGAPSDQEIYDSLIRKSDRLSNAAGKRYKQITSDMAGVEVPISGTVSTIDSQLARLNKPGAIRNEKLTNILNNIKSDLTSGAQDINLLRDNRTRFREEVKGKDAITNDTEQRIINSVYDAMTNDMNNAVRSNLGDAQAEALKQVDSIWAKEKVKIGKTKLKNVLSKGDIRPSEASKMLFNAPPEDIKILYATLDQSGRKNARAALIEKATNEGTATPEEFLRNINKLKDQHNTFFRGKDSADLNGLIKYLEFTKRASQAPVVTPTGISNLQVGVPAGMLADYSLTGGVTTGAFAGIGALARAYESTAVRNIMAKMASIPKGSTQFEKAASLLEKELQKAATKAPQSVNQDKKPKLNQ